MDFAYTPEEVQVRELTERLCADFDDACNDKFFLRSRCGSNKLSRGN
jgi:hypothetical protein